VKGNQHEGRTQKGYGSTFTNVWMKARNAFKYSFDTTAQLGPTFTVRNHQSNAVHSRLHSQSCLLNGPPDAQPLRNTQISCGTRRFITAFTRARQCGILDISQPYKPPWPAAGIAVLYFLRCNHCVSCALIVCVALCAAFCLSLVCYFV
jgi:hypothetical protein